MDWQTTLEKLRSDRRPWAAIARDVDLPAMTVARICRGETASPGIRTVQKIVEYYERNGATQ
jgi:hypothetical protein